jgi:hypothetical protein
MPPFKIFVSSTKMDLVSYRIAVRNKLEELKKEFDIEIIGMEDFGARSEPPLQTCLDEVGGSDMYIGIIGMRYGSIDGVTKKSFTHLEYEKAIENKLPIRVYLIDENEGRIPPNSVQCDKRKQLKKFKDILKDKHTCPAFTNEENLASQIELDVRKHLQAAGKKPKEQAEGKISSKTPFISGTLKRSILVKGDALIIRGVATKAPARGIAVWIFGKDYFNHSTVQVFPDDSFEYILSPEQTKSMEAGQYFVILQHPMLNGEFDVFPIEESIRTIVKNTQNSDFFVVDGISKIAGPEAAKYFVEMINTSHVDDTYTKLSFLVEEPLITINPLGEIIVGKPMLINGSTNISTDHDLLVEVKSVAVERSDVKRVFSVDGFGTLAAISHGPELNTWQTTVAQAVLSPGKYYVHVLSDALGVMQITEFTAVEK